MAYETSLHHIVPISKGGANCKGNLIRLNHDFHVAFHKVFENLPPHEQIGRILEMASTALTQDFRQEISKILADDSEYIYERGIIKPRNA